MQYARVGRHESRSDVISTTTKIADEFGITTNSFTDSFTDYRNVTNQSTSYGTDELENWLD